MSEIPKKRARTSSSDGGEDEANSKAHAVVRMRLQLLDSTMSVCNAALKGGLGHEERDIIVRCVTEIASCGVATATVLNKGDTHNAAKYTEQCLKFLRELIEHSRSRLPRRLFEDLSRPLLASALLSNSALSEVRTVQADELQVMADRWGRETIASSLSYAARLNLLDFPWKRLTMGDPAALFSNVRERTLERIDCADGKVPGVRISAEASQFVHLGYHHSAGENLGFKTSLDDYFKADVLTDYFQEEPRLNARRRGQQQTILEQWRSGKAAFDAAMYIMESQNHDLCTFELREALYHKHYEECTQFKCTLARSFFDLYKARSVLDFSAGWGDRLIGAIAAESVTRYVGVDPNEGLRNGHDAIKNMFCPLAGKDPNSFTIVYEPFQTATLPDDAAVFDLVYTSPPFFDFEIYTDDEHARGQSVHEYPQYERWAAHFLLASMRKAWNCLADDGHLAIYITDVRGAPVVELMGLYAAARLSGCEFVGAVMSVGDAEKPRPTWVWHKHESKIDEDKQKQAELLFQRLYPVIVKELDKQ